MMDMLPPSRNLLIVLIVGMMTLLDKRLSNGKGKRLRTGIRKFDTEGAIADLSFLPDQLIQALLAYHAVALIIDIHAVIRAGRSAVQRDLEAHRVAAAGAQHQMKIPPVKTETDRAARFLQGGGVTGDQPL